MNDSWMAAMTGSAVLLGLVTSRWGSRHPHPLVLLAIILAGVFSVVVCTVPALFHVGGLRHAVFVADWLCMVTTVRVAVKVCRWGGSTSCGGAW